MFGRNRAGNEHRLTGLGLGHWNTSGDREAQVEGHPELERPALMSIAANSGRQAGLAAASGNHFADTIESLPGRRSLASKVGERKELVERSAARAREALQSSVRGLEAEEAVERERLAAAQQSETSARARLEGMQGDPESRGAGLSGVGYPALLLLLAAAEFPTVYSSLSASLLEQWAVWILTVALSLVVAVSAHLVGLNLAHYQREDGSDTRRVYLVIVVLISILMVVLMSFMWQTRSNLFETAVAGRRAQGLRTDGLNVSLLSSMFFALQLLLFGVATVMSFNRGRNAPAVAKARAARKERSALKREHKRAEKEAKTHSRAYDQISHALDSSRNSIEVIATSLLSCTKQEDALLESLCAEFDTAFQSGRLETNATALAQVTAPAITGHEFRPLEVKS